MTVVRMVKEAAGIHRKKTGKKKKEMCRKGNKGKAIDARTKIQSATSDFLTIYL